MARPAPTNASPEKSTFPLPWPIAHNRRIVDLANAVNLKNGQVAFSSDFVAIRPKDLSKGNGSMLLEIPNRGSAFIVSLVDGGARDEVGDPGDGWLLRRGFTIVSLGWQWDSPGGLRLDAPIAKDHGKTITGLLRGDLTIFHETDEIPLGHFITGRIGGTEYPVADPNDPAQHADGARLARSSAHGDSALKVEVCAHRERQAGAQQPLYPS